MSAAAPLPAAAPMMGSFGAPMMGGAPMMMGGAPMMGGTPYLPPQILSGSAQISGSAQPIPFPTPMGTIQTPIMQGATTSMQAPIMAAPMMTGAPVMGMGAPMSAPMGAPIMMGATQGIQANPAAPYMQGTVHPEFPQLGAAQPYPTTVTPQDEMLLQRLNAMGPAGTDGMPGYPYIGAPYIGVYKGENEFSEGNQEEYVPPQQDDDEVRGTQV
mmetsp:Transcript_41595/g.64919  ORF Transcript_41595/g.64919 Transcript_41595/m.64919 type:complete len:214 (-) Transcript_41595:104-745(-)